MPPIPILSGEQVIHASLTLGWEIARRQGSHVILVKEGHRATLSIPNHKEVVRGTLRGLIRESGMTVEEFLSALD
jgi:predicted RNA binding protein YcfA (HicA-like mRNA interferase family)